MKIKINLQSIFLIALLLFFSAFFLVAYIKICPYVPGGHSWISVLAPAFSFYAFDDPIQWTAWNYAPSVAFFYGSLFKILGEFSPEICFYLNFLLLSCCSFVSFHLFVPDEKKNWRAVLFTVTLTFTPLLISLSRTTFSFVYPLYCNWLLFCLSVYVLREKKRPRFALLFPFFFFVFFLHRINYVFFIFIMAGLTVGYKRTFVKSGALFRAYCSVVFLGGVRCFIRLFFFHQQEHELGMAGELFSPPYSLYWNTIVYLISPVLVLLVFAYFCKKGRAHLNKTDPAALSSFVVLLFVPVVFFCCVFFKMHPKMQYSYVVIPFVFILSMISFSDFRRIIQTFFLTLQLICFTVVLFHNSGYAHLIDLDVAVFREEAAILNAFNLYFQDKYDYAKSYPVLGETNYKIGYERLVDKCRNILKNENTCIYVATSHEVNFIVHQALSNLNFKEVRNPLFVNIDPLHSHYVLFSVPPQYGSFWNDQPCERLPEDSIFRYIDQEDVVSVATYPTKGIRKDYSLVLVKMDYDLVQSIKDDIQFAFTVRF